MNLDRLALYNFALNWLALDWLAALIAASFSGVCEQHCCQRKDETKCSHRKTLRTFHTADNQPSVQH
jgi:hypothetical protein